MDAVLAYGVDGLAEQTSKAALLEELGLDPDTFFRELYVSRPPTERELFAQMESGSLHTFLVGPIGCGKTTLLHFVLRQYCSQFRLPLLLIDMKTAGVLSPDSYSIATRIEDACKRQIALYLSTQYSLPPGAPADPVAQPDFTTLAAILLEPINQIFIPPQRFAAVHRLTAMHSLSSDKAAGVGFSAWLSSTLRTPTHASHAEVQRILTDFTVGLTLVELAFAIAELGRRELKTTRRLKVVIALDNLDAIEDPILRDQLIEWMKSQSSSYSAVATFTACIRPQNLPVARKGSMSLRALWGEDGSPLLKLSVGDSDVDTALLREWETYLRSQYYDRHLEDPGYAELSEEQRKRQAFDDMIHVRRVDFVAKAVEQGRISGVTRPDLRAVSQAAKEVLAIGSLGADVRMQANGNRRVMLAGVTNFLEYVVRDLNLDWDLVGVGPDRQRPQSTAAWRERRGSAIKSLYYKFLGSGHSDEVQPPVFDSRVFDPVRMVLDSGWKGTRLDPPTGTKGVCQSCRSLLVLLGVYNACGNTLSVWSDQAVQVRSVARVCEALGLTPQDVYATIEETVRSVGVRFAGVFDIDHFLPIYDNERSIAGDERIIATDRCRRLLGAVVYMFNYLCERLRQHGASARASAEDSDLMYRGLVSAALVEDFAVWIRKAVLIETWWIEAVHASKPAGSLRNAYEHYCTDFVVKRSHAGSASMLTQGITKSAIGYLKFSLDNHIQPDEAALRKAYERARDELTKVDRKLDAIEDRLRKGQGWGIPRNEALPIA